jgi:hypothetical protein
VAFSFGPAVTRAFAGVEIGTAMLGLVFNSAPSAVAEVLVPVAAADCGDWFCARDSS